MKKVFLFLVYCLFFPVAAGAGEAVPKPAGSAQELERLPGIYCVAGHGGVVGSVYLVKTAEPVLIDCGSRVGWDQLAGNLKLLGMSPGDIRWVVATHGHWDHMDAMTVFQKEYPNVKFAIHAGDAQFVLSDDRVFSCAEPLTREFSPGPSRWTAFCWTGTRWMRAGPFCE
jgi:glyoxylase-like metal-dependent hydrolase (beta-lactamase superfamily II)